MNIQVNDAAPTPTLTPPTLNVREGELVSVQCAAPVLSDMDPGPGGHSGDSAGATGQDLCQSLNSDLHCFLHSP